MDERERPRRFRILIIDDYERGNLVGYGEAAKDALIDGMVMGTQISDEKNKDSERFRTRSELTEQIVRCAGAARVAIDGKTERLCNALSDRLDTIRNFGFPNERKLD